MSGQKRAIALAAGLAVATAALCCLLLLLPPPLAAGIYHPLFHVLLVGALLAAVRATRIAPAPLRLALPLGRREVGFTFLVAILTLVVAGAACMALRASFLGLERGEDYRRRGFLVQTGEREERLSVQLPEAGSGPHRDPVDVFDSVLGGSSLLAVAVAAGAFLGAVAALATLRRRLRPSSSDGVLVPLALFLSGLGVVLLIRLAPDIPRVYAARFPSCLSWPLLQSLATAVGAAALVAAIIAGHYLGRHEWLQVFFRRRIGHVAVYHLFAAAAVALTLGTAIAGTRRFGAVLSLTIAGKDVQIVEIAKVLLAYYAAYYLADLEQRRRRDSDNGQRQHTYCCAPAGTIPHLLVLLAVGAAGLLTGDVGFVLLCGALLVAVAVVGLGDLLLPVLVVVGAPVMGAVVLWLEQPFRAYHRLASWLDPFAHSETLALARWSLAEGGLWGAGLARGMPYTVPNADSDFALVTIAEELGLVGAGAVLGLYACMLHRGFDIAVREVEPFRKHLATSVTLLLAAQVAVIAAGSTGLLPLTGVPLPFVSRGGMTAILTMYCIGVLVQLSFVYHGGEEAQPERWVQVNRRLRHARLATHAMLALCFLWLGAQMTLLSASTARRPFQDRPLAEALQALADGGVYSVRAGRVRFDADKMEPVAELLPAGQRQLVRADLRRLRALADAFEVREGKPVLASSAVGRANPRTIARPAFSVRDRRGRVVAVTDSHDTRRYPFAWSLFPVLGHSRFGAPLFLENDLPALIRRIETGILPPRVAVTAVLSRLRRLAASVRGDGTPAQARRQRAPYQVTLTIDAELQARAMRLLDEALNQLHDPARPPHAGAAALVMDVRTGELLAVASVPSFNPAAAGSEPWGRQFRDPELQLKKNRAIHGLYPPGSVFKLVTAAAAAEVGADRSPVSCQGTDPALGIRDYQVAAGNDSFRHGAIALREALAQSCNVYFATMGVVIGDELTRIARRLGFGRAFPLLPLPGEIDLAAVPSHFATCHSVAGSAALPACAGANTGTVAPVQDTYLREHPLLLSRAAVGQTLVEVTPLQMLLVTATIARGGELVAPQLLRRLERSDATYLEMHEQALGRVLSKLAARRVAGGMVAAAASGTAAPSVLSRRPAQVGARFSLAGPKHEAQWLPFAAKTGTAEVEGLPSHAWFTAFAPVETPRVAVTVLLEHGGFGGHRAGPIAMELLAAALESLRREDVDQAAEAAGTSAPRR
ncbi:MAG: FtsW/RodA/SpoVE family cell cycle protein [Candidatus Schekmanbacteria bacterium]|nr:FtsW/RodA/SpoVE family cell cycle protein [Candidatus Schekmanbacteria bacterium]